MVLYSYAAHLRKNTYHQLPLTERAHATRERIVASRAPTTTVIIAEEVTDELAAAEAEHHAENGGPPPMPRRSSETVTHSRPAGPPRAATAPAKVNGREGKPNIEAVEDESFSWD